MFYAAGNFPVKPQTINRFFLLRIKGISVFLTVLSVDLRALECLLSMQIPGLHPNPSSGVGFRIRFQQVPQVILSTLTWEPLRRGVEGNEYCFVGLKLSWAHNVTFVVNYISNVHWVFYTHSLLNTLFTETLGLVAATN